MIVKICTHFILLALLAVTGCSSANHSEPSATQPVQTVVYLIRHAEKADAGTNPDLSAEGLQRAQNWAGLLQQVPFDAFYSTNYKRTLQTIEPIATQNQKEVTLYDPFNFSLAEVVATNAGGNVFIVGHSNTIPQLINSYLGSEFYPDMTEFQFGNLYKITVTDGVVSHQMTVHN